MLRAALIVAYLLGAAISPAFAWEEPMPGESGWPPIPHGGGLSAFVSKKWMPQCERMAYGGYFLHLTPDGNLIHERYLASAKQAWPSEQYRPVSVSGNYAIVLVRTDLGKGHGEYRFWSFRPERVHGGTVTAMRVGQCGENRRGQLPLGKSWHPDFLHDGLWAMNDAELEAYWKGHECNPANSSKTPNQPFWGEGWEQYCPYVASNSAD